MKTFPKKCSGMQIYKLDVIIQSLFNNNLQTIKSV